MVVARELRMKGDGELVFKVLEMDGSSGCVMV